LLTKLIPSALILLLSACSNSQSPAFQEDRQPEDRDQYSGAEGLVQLQKDQSYLMKKELTDQCMKAKVDLAMALTDNNEAQIEVQTDLISRTCI
jgi:hypothetical protein